MLELEQARRKAAEWMEAWNAHDLEGILEHYSEEIEFVSPFAVRLAGAPDGVVRGKPALREYFSRALAAYPELQFRPHFVCAGAHSFTAVYESVNGLQAVEVFELDEAGMVRRVLAHYAPLETGNA